MFARFFALIPLVALVSAGHLSARDSQCSAEKQYCCDSTITDGTTFVQHADGLIVALVDAVADVPITCSVIGVDGCSQQTVCCDNVKQNGLVNVACSPMAVAV